MKNRSIAYPLVNIEFRGIHFECTDLGTGPLIDVLNTIKKGNNIWLDSCGAPMKSGISVYNRELLPGAFVIAFDTEEARCVQVEASKQLEGRDTGKYTLPDITTFFEIEKDDKKLYCYMVDRMDMWKHKKDMLMGEVDNVSIDGIIVYPHGFLGSSEYIQRVSNHIETTLKDTNLVPH